MSSILVTEQHGIATLSFNRPEAMNTLNDIMAQEMHDAVSHLIQKDSVRVIILRGSGQLFMAGGDIGFFYKHLENIGDKAQQILVLVNEIIIMLQRTEKLVIAAVHGSVAGVGMSFMLAADLVIAADEAKFTLAYSKIGATPDGGITFNLPRIVGPKKSMELALLSDIFDVKMAKMYGLINWIVKAEELDQETLNIATHLAEGPLYAYANIKHLINNTWKHSLEQQLHEEAEAFIATAKTEDFKKGVTAFLNKTKTDRHEKTE